VRKALIVPVCHEQFDSRVGATLVISLLVILLDNLRSLRSAQVFGVGKANLMFHPRSRPSSFSVQTCI
jgi:hypothetical protein